MVLHDLMELDPGQPDVSPTSGHPPDLGNRTGEKIEEKGGSSRLGQEERLMPFRPVQHPSTPTGTDSGPMGGRGGRQGQRGTEGTQIWEVGLGHILDLLVRSPCSQGV